MINSAEVLGPLISRMQSLIVIERDCPVDLKELAITLRSFRRLAMPLGVVHATNAQAARNRKIILYLDQAGEQLRQYGEDYDPAHIANLGVAMTSCYGLACESNEPYLPRQPRKSVLGNLLIVGWW